MINIVTSSRYKINKKMLAGASQHILSTYDDDTDSLINIIFVGSRQMKKIAAKYKHENVALPVLGFPYKQKSDNEMLVGEIFICYPQAILLAAERAKRVDEMMVWLIEHGINNLYT